MTHGRGLRALLVAVVCAATFGTATVARADVGAQGCSARAVVVVEPGPGPVSICFDGSISGLDALQLAGANPVTYGFSGQGAAVCQLYGVGNPPDQSCLTGPQGQYWAYYRAAPGASGWTYSRAGAATTTVVDGSVEGWRYGTGAAPGFVAFCAVVSCAPPATDPPPTAPPAAAPTDTSGAAASPAASGLAPGATGASGSAATTGPASTQDGRDPGSADAGSKSGAASTAAAANGKDRTDGTAGNGNRHAQRSSGVALGTGTGSGPDTGSPVGVIVAVAVVALGVGAGLWRRRRRRGPTPG